MYVGEGDTAFSLLLPLKHGEGHRDGGGGWV